MYRFAIAVGCAQRSRCLLLHCLLAKRYFSGLCRTEAISRRRPEKVRSRLFVRTRDQNQGVSSRRTSSAIAALLPVSVVTSRARPLASKKNTALECITS